MMTARPEVGEGVEHRPNGPCGTPGRQPLRHAVVRLVERVHRTRQREKHPESDTCSEHARQTGERRSVK